MAKEFKNYRDESKFNWGAYCEPGQNISTEQLQVGALLRIADASEKMASNYTALQKELDRYKGYYESRVKECEKLRKQVAGLRGVITKMKKKS